MHMEYDSDADAIYIRLAQGRRSATKSLDDDDRHVDEADDGSPLGVEFLNVSAGIDLKGVPRGEEIASLLAIIRDVKVA